MDGWKFLTSIVDTANASAKQYQECNTLVTRIEVRIMRLKGEECPDKKVRCKLQVQATRESKRT